MKLTHQQFLLAVTMLGGTYTEYASAIGVLCTIEGPINDEVCLKERTMIPLAEASDERMVDNRFAMLMWLRGSLGRAVGQEEVQA